MPRFNPWFVVCFYAGVHTKSKRLTSKHAPLSDSDSVPVVTQIVLSSGFRHNLSWKDLLKFREISDILSFRQNEDKISTFWI